MSTSQPQAIRLADYQPPAFLIDTVHLDITFKPTATEVTAKLNIRPNPDANASAKNALVLDGEKLKLKSIALDGKPLTKNQYNIDGKSLTVLRPPSKAFELETKTIIDPDNNTALQGIYRSRGIYCSQCEAEGFRRITYFLDRPDVLSVYTVRLVADRDEAPVLLANGNPREKGTMAKNNLYYAVWHDPHPKPCYLFAVVAGDLGSIASNFKTRSGRNVDLRIYVEHGKEDRAHWAMDSLKRAMAWDEERFDREYDLDVFNIVAVSDFNMGAMENKGLNIFNDRLVLASPETATDANYTSIESVIAHEYFHNWTGNRITCRDWFQLCLKEGLTVFRDQEFSADERSRMVQRINDVRQLLALQFPEDQGPLAHPVRPESYIEINNFYTPTVYEKGAEVIRMIETTVGPADFRKGMNLFFERHDGEAATVEDFVACFQDASGKDFTQFFNWYQQAGTPELVCRFSYDKVKKTAKLDIRQNLKPSPGQPEKQPYTIPLRFGLIGANGNDIAIELSEGKLLNDSVLDVSEHQQTFRFEKIPSRPVPSLLRGFSAPVTINMDCSNKDLAFLMTHDSDLFNRWQAANNLATNIMLKEIAKPASEMTKRGMSRSFANAVKATLQDPELEPAYKAELLKLPSTADIARELGKNVNPTKIHTVHTAFSHDLANELQDHLKEIYANVGKTDEFSPSAEASGERALRNSALTLLTGLQTTEDWQRLGQHYEHANNMTDQAHALGLIASNRHPKRNKYLKDFADRWRDDHLVMDLWFSVQARSPLPDTIKRIHELAKHELFSLKTPNKVRALIGAFAMGNPVQFNRADGKGYAFVADKVLEVDALNPQIAARLLGAFRSYKGLEPRRRSKAREVLQKVADVKKLSRDSYEIVTRMLED